MARKGETHVGRMVKRGIAMLVPLLSAGVAVVGVAGPASADSGPWRIWAQSNTSLCLQSGGASGRDITVQTCGSSAAQKFYFRVSNSSGYGQWVTDNWGYCLNITGAVYANNTHIISYKCTGGNDWWQPIQWTVTSPNYYQMLAESSAGNMSWNVSGSVEKAGAPLVLYDFKTSYQNSLFSWRSF
jgi:hypothetical protein